MYFFAFFRHVLNTVQITDLASLSLPVFSIHRICTVCPEQGTVTQTKVKMALTVEKTASSVLQLIQVDAVDGKIWALRLIMVLVTACIMCVQYIGGCSLHQGDTISILSYNGFS